MKRIILFLISFLFIFTLKAQSDLDTLLYQDFDTLTPYEPFRMEGWVNVDTAANGQNVFEVKSHSGNQYVQISAHGTDTVVKAILITPEIELPEEMKVTLSFDVKVAYWDHDGLKVFISDNFDLDSDTLGSINEATWTELPFDFPNEPTNTFGEFINYTYDLMFYGGKHINIMFYYEGDEDQDLTTTYQIDNILITAGAATPIEYVYTLNDTTIVVKYKNKVMQFEPALIKPVISSDANYDTLTIDDDSTTVYLYFDQLPFDCIIDTVYDLLNSTYGVFYAGFADIKRLNAVYVNGDSGVVNDIILTVGGYVTADDDYNQVWIAQEAGSYNGILVYDGSRSLPADVNPGDYIVLYGTRSVYNGATELVYKDLIKQQTNAGTIEPVQITGATINDELEEDEPNAEQYEGVLVTIKNVYVKSGPDEYYQYIGTDDHGATQFIIDDDIDYHWQSLGDDTIIVGAFYDMKGIVHYSYGQYKLLPLQKDYDGLVWLRTNVENTDNQIVVYPNPVENVLNIYGDQLQAVEIYNTLGQKVINRDLYGSKATIDLSDLSSGIYLVNIRTKKGSESIKIIKK